MEKFSNIGMSGDSVVFIIVFVLYFSGEEWPFYLFNSIIRLMLILHFYVLSRIVLFSFFSHFYLLLSLIGLCHWNFWNPINPNSQRFIKKLDIY